MLLVSQPAKACALTCWRWSSSTIRPSTPAVPGRLPSTAGLRSTGHRGMHSGTNDIASRTTLIARSGRSFWQSDSRPYRRIRYVNYTKGS